MARQYPHSVRFSAKTILTWLFMVGLSFSVTTLLTACMSQPVSSKPDQPPRSINEPFPLVKLGQTLPISATTTIAGQTIYLEVARTPAEQSMGLMHRTSVPDDRGMLFPFNPPMVVGFWMKNVKINLDMVFLYQGQVHHIAADVPPCKTDPCPLYGPRVPIDQVIELRGGRAAELGIKVGDRITVKFLDTPPKMQTRS